MNRRRIFLVLASWWLLLGAVNLAWLSRDTRPPTWDPANHLTSWIRYRHALEDGFAGSSGLGKTVSKILRVDDHYPPLAPLAAALLSLPFPATPSAATLILTQGALAVLLLAVFLLGRDLGNTETGTAAAVAASSFALIAVWSRSFMLDLPEAAMTALALLFLWRTENFRRFGSSLAFGAVLGLALLTKWTCTFFLLFPLVYFIWCAFRQVDRPRRLRNVALSLLTALVLAAPWYTAHLWNIARDLTIFSYRVGVEEGDPPVFSARSLLFYARSLPSAILLPWFLLFLAGIFLLLRSRRPLRPLLFLWFAGGWAILTLVRNKDERYLMPMLPAVALIATVWLPETRLPAAVRTGGIATLSLLSLAVSWQRSPPKNEPWPVAQAVDFLAKAGSHPAKRLRVVPDCPYYERHAFELYAELARFPLDVGSWYNFPAFTDFVATKTGPQGVHSEAAVLARRIEGGEDDFNLLFKAKWEHPLPDGTSARIYERDISPVADVSAEEVLSKLEGACFALAQQRLRNIRGWRILVEPFSPEETMRGHFRRVLISAESASLRAGHRAEITISGLGLDASDLTINPHLLLRSGELQVLSLAQIIPRASLSEGSVSRAFASRAEGQTPSVQFRSGAIRLASAPLELWLEPEVVGGSNIRLEVKKLRLCGVPLPSALLQALITGNNPILRPMPCRVRLESLRVEDEVLAINE